MNNPRSIHTVRLELVNATVEMLRTESADPAALGKMIDAVLPEGWPEAEYREALPQLLKGLEEAPGREGWWLYYWVTKGNAGDERVLIGNGGFHGLPSEDGTVEIGYGVAPPYRGMGYAGEAVFGLVAYAFGRPEVSRIIADTGDDNEPSKRILNNMGFRKIGPGAEPGTTRYELPRVLFQSRAKIY